MSTSLNFGTIDQVAYLTDDIESAINAWMSQAGIGPWVLYKGLNFPAFYKGEPTQVLMDVGLSYRGDTQIELIQQHNDAPSPYLAFFQQKNLGMHHVGYTTDNIDAVTELASSRGYEIIFNGGDETMGRYAYVTHPQLPGVFQEFLEMNEMLQAVWSDLKEKANRWDGTPDIQVVQF